MADMKQYKTCGYELSVCIDGGYLEGRRRMPLVVRWMTDDVGRDDEAVFAGMYRVVASWREIGELISTCPGFKMERDFVILERVV